MRAECRRAAPLGARDCLVTDKGTKVADAAGAPQRLLEAMASAVPAVLARIEPGTGRLLNPNGRFAVFDQHTIYALAYLYRMPGTGWQGRKELLDAARGMGDAIVALQNPDGSFPLVKDDGTVWGNSTLPWHTGPWLEAWRLLGEALDPDARERWRAGLARWMGRVAAELADNGRLHNIQAYCAAILVRGSRLLGIPEYEPVGESFLRKIAALQTADGYWPEGGNPTLIYNLVYLHALGLYHVTTAASWVRPHLERGLSFHRRFSYPDGTCVETVDGRVRHHPHAFALGGMAFLPFPAGRKLVAVILEGHVATAVPGTLNGNLAYILEHWAVEPETAPSQEAPDGALALGGRALTRRTGDWFWCLSGLGVPAGERQRFLNHRWQNDLGQRLSLWNAALGLTVGGGSSRLQPAFHTFSVLERGTLHVAPDAARIESNAGGEDVLCLEFGPVRCTLGVRLLADQSVCLRWRADWPAMAPDVSVTAGLTLPYLLDRDAQSSLAGTTPETLGARKDVVWIERPAAPLPPWTLSVGRLQVDLPAGTTFHWPEYPFNPYAIDNAAPAESAVGALCFPLGNGEERRVTVRVRE